MTPENPAQKKVKRRGLADSLQESAGVVDSGPPILFLHLHMVSNPASSESIVREYSYRDTESPIKGLDSSITLYH
jgi:hypothetical protein